MVASPIKKVNPEYSYFSLRELNASKFLETGIYWISPAIAKHLLGRNLGNRNISKHMVQRYAKQMREGRWGISDPITFSESGCLINGQHRMRAVIAANVDVLFQITLNAPAEAALYYDQGKKRTANDISIINGDPVSKLQISTVRAMGVWSRSTREMSANEVLDAFDVHREAIEFATQDFTEFPNRRFSTGLFRSAVAKAYYYENHLRLEEFVKCLESGLHKNMEDDSACIRLRENFLSTDSLERRLGRVEWYRKIEKSLHNFCLRKQVKRSSSPANNPIYPLPMFDNMQDPYIKRRVRNIIIKL